MEQRDYLLRYIEHFSEALAKVMGLVKTGKPDDGLKYVEQLYENYFEGNRITLIESSEEELGMALAQGMDMQLEELQFAADLLYHEGELWENKGEVFKAKVRFVRSLRIMEYLHKEDPVYNLDRAFKIEKVRAML